MISSQVVLLAEQFPKQIRLPLSVLWFKPLMLTKTRRFPLLDALFSRLFLSASWLAQSCSQV